METKFQLPRVKPEGKTVTFEFLYQQQQVLATMQNFLSMAMIAITELDTKFQNPDNNRRMQSVIDNLYAIQENLKKHPRYKFKPNDEDQALDVAGETYELNKLLMHLDTRGIITLINTIKTAMAQGQAH